MKRIKRFLVLCLVCAMVLGLAAIPASAAVFSTADAEAYVTQLYKGLLGRDPDGGGLTGYVNQLYNQKVSAGTVAQGFLGSAEFRARQLTNEQYIDVLYRGLLGREADADGKASFLSFMGCGQSRTWVYQQILASAEFKNLCEGKYNMYVGDYPTGSNSANPNPTSVNVAEATPFVKGLYKALLNREADVGGLQNWVNMLTLRKMSAAGVACAIASSAEFNAKPYTNSEFITRCYQGLLGRDPDVGGYTNFINALNSGKSRAWVFAAICNSAEFQHRAAFAPGAANIAAGTLTASQSSNVGGNAVNPTLADEYVKRLYVNFLKREGEGERQVWVDKLVNRQLSAAGVAAAIASSGEAKNIGRNREEYVDVLYWALLGRAPDTVGKGDFVKALTQGYSRSWAFCKICASAEFQKQSCFSDMNVVPGTLNYTSYDMG